MISLNNDALVPRFDAGPITAAASRYNRPASVRQLLSSDPMERAKVKALSGSILEKLSLALTGHAGKEIPQVDRDDASTAVVPLDRFDVTTTNGVVSIVVKKAGGLTYAEHFGIAMSGGQIDPQTLSTLTTLDALAPAPLTLEIGARGL